MTSSAQMWPEVTTVINESRKELVISGAADDVLRRIESGGLDERIYSLKGINLLEVTKCKLTEVNSRIGEMTGLTSLLFHHNALTSFPSSIGALTKLSLLDLSFNQLESLPPLDRLVSLDTLNVSSNKLTSLPDLSTLTNLHVVIAGNNCLTEFPKSLISDKLVHLHTLLFADNMIGDLPAEISCLKSLKNFDLSNNKVKIVPSELSLCLKLKDLAIRGNKLADRRLQKLVDQLHTKHVTAYLTEIYEKEEEARKKTARDNAKNKKKVDTALKQENTPESNDTGNGNGNNNNDVSEPDAAPQDDADTEGKINVRVIHFDAGIKSVVDQKESVLSVRPHILCCIVRGLDLKRTTNTFKRFISLQNNLHDTVCDKRQAATIAVHDLNTCFFPLSYECRPSDALEITPLFGNKPISAKQLVANLVNEADEIRRQKKRSSFTGLHKYLDMVKDAAAYACLIDSQGAAISFPPITNALKTKCVSETRDVLLEVTSNQSLDVCRRVMLALINEIINLFTNPAPPAGKDFEFVFEQVRIHDVRGQLKSVFPSSADFRDEERLNVTFAYPENKKGG